MIMCQQDRAPVICSGSCRCDKALLQAVTLDIIVTSLLLSTSCIGRHRALPFTFPRAALPDSALHSCCR
jgi:hypothetical protein